MKVGSPKEYFNLYIAIVSAMMPDESRLTWKEVDFLTECCLYNYQGHDLSDMQKLTDHFIDIKFFKRREDVSTYKCKIGTKKWAVTGRNQFELPPALDLTPGDDMNYTLQIELAEVDA